MAYKPVPDDPTESNIVDFLEDVASRKEFLITKSAVTTVKNKAYAGFNLDEVELSMPGMRLHGAQHFVRAFHNPNTESERILIEWQTGSGKSICVIALAHEFIKQFRDINNVGIDPPSVVIISFSVRETIQEDLLKYPEFGFVSKEDAEKLKYMRSKSGAQGSNRDENRSYTALVGTLRRRITDQSRGGYYRFYGYKEFANKLFEITPDGANVGFDIQQLYRQSAENFDKLLDDASKRGYVNVNHDLVNSLRNGLLICDEIHDVYNISETNNYGIAIQYVLDKLGTTAPRAVFMSATPITGSAAEIVGLLNLLVPRHKLPEGKPLQRSDFFTRSKFVESTSFMYNDISYSIKKIKELEQNAKTQVIKLNKIKIVPESESGGQILVMLIAKELILIYGADVLNQMIADRVDHAEVKIITATQIITDQANANDDIEAAELTDLASQFIISHLKDGAIERIAQLAAGRVSFLLDSDVTAYPKKWFLGEQVQDVPYLSITKCPMSEFHQKTVEHEHKLQGHERAPNAGFNAISYTLYDIAFPNPSDPNCGLYSSSDTLNKLETASAEWKAASGIHVNRKSDEITTITGDFLKLSNIKNYSTKYYELIRAVLDAVNSGPGKIMIYHHRVRMSGVLLLQEAMKQNGFIDEFSNPTDSTICSVCGLKRSNHYRATNSAESNFIFGGKPDEDSDEEDLGIDFNNEYKDEIAQEINKDDKHEFIPARFVVAHSDVEKSMMNRSIARFNANGNLYGHKYRLIIGSKIIRQGLNFKAVRHQFVASLPTDYPTLMQVFGRVVRKDSHADLKPEDRDVNIRVFVSTYANNTISPELQRYMDKGKEFLVIQRVERALHEFAVDGFINYDRIKNALAIDSTYTNSLHGMVYKPKVLELSAITDATFLAYGYGEKEVATIAAACRVLFKYRPVWTADDLWKALKARLIAKLYYNSDEFDEGNFALALELLQKPSGFPLTTVVKTGKYYIYTKVDQLMKPVIDIESYLREAPHLKNTYNPRNVSIQVSDFIKKTRSGLEFTIKLKEFERKYLVDNESPVEMSLVECDAQFHYDLQRALILSTKKITANDGAIIEMYKNFKLCFTHDDMLNIKGAKNYHNGAKMVKPDKIVAYLITDSVVVYEFQSDRWYNMSFNDVGISKRTNENDIIIGYVSQQPGNSQIGKAESRYKIRPPIQKMETSKGDNRLIVKGAVCSSRSRDELLSHINALRRVLVKYKTVPDTVVQVDEQEDEEIEDVSIDVAQHAALNYVAVEDKVLTKKSPSASELCRLLCVFLLGLEQISRNSKKDSTRWMYLHCDKAPLSGAIGGADYDHIKAPNINPRMYEREIAAAII